jgi:hypothetical protein
VTPRLALDGTEYEIGLNAEHHRALRDALARRHWATINGALLPRLGGLACGLSPDSWVVGSPASLISVHRGAAGLHVYALLTLLRTRCHAA